MTNVGKKAILDLAQSKNPKITEHNTCNAWGFGGSIKTVYKFKNGWELHNGRLYYRHMPANELFFLQAGEDSHTNKNVILALLKTLK